MARPSSPRRRFLPLPPRDGPRDLPPRLVQDRLVVRSLPRHHPFDNAVQPLALRLLVIRDVGKRIAPRPRGRVVHQLREQHRPARRQRPPRPPQMQRRGGVPMPDGLLTRRGDVDRLKGYRDFDELLTRRGHAAGRIWSSASVTSAGAAPVMRRYSAWARCHGVAVSLPIMFSSIIASSFLA